MGGEPEEHSESVGLDTYLGELRIRLDRITRAYFCRDKETDMPVAQLWFERAQASEDAPRPDVAHSFLALEYGDADRCAEAITHYVRRYPERYEVHRTEYPGGVDLYIDKLPPEGRFYLRAPIEGRET